MPGWPLLVQSPVSIGSPAGLKAVPVRRVRPQRRPASVLARAGSVAIVVQVRPPFVLWRSELSASKASTLLVPGSAARASGVSASFAFSTPADQLAPELAVVASGVKSSSWLGRNPASSELGPVGATARPPLLATPGGVTSRQEPPAAGRASNCQKALARSEESPSTRVAQSRLVVATEVARDSGGGWLAVLTETVGWEAPPQPAASSAMPASAAVSRGGRRRFI